VVTRAARGGSKAIGEYGLGTAFQLVEPPKQVVLQFIDRQ
jgi:hypothetical protein